MKTQENIVYFYEDTSFQLTSETNTSSWIQTIIEKEGFVLSHINYIFCSDPYLLAINKEYLQHDFFTDILTFDQSGKENEIEADIYISIDRVTDNAETLHISFADELLRVIIHGILHLIGFSDKTESEKTLMREKEDSCISLHK